VIETFVSLKIKLEQQGARIDDVDLTIAATAIHLNYTLVTNNTRHFARIPDLLTVNWTKTP